MKQTGIVMPGYRMNDYIVILNPPAELSNKIRVIREDFNKEYRVPSTPGKPNLLLCSFTQLTMMEDRIIRNLARLRWVIRRSKLK
ncbi:MAG: hypothetical protein WDO19_30360 [Bacteroidota bacterium]